MFLDVTNSKDYKAGFDRADKQIKIEYKETYVLKIGKMDVEKELEKGRKYGLLK